MRPNSQLDQLPGLVSTPYLPAGWHIRVGILRLKQSAWAGQCYLDLGRGSNDVVNAQLAEMKMYTMQDSLLRTRPPSPYDLHGLTAKGAQCRTRKGYDAHLSRFSTMRRALAATRMSIMRLRMPASHKRTQYG